MVSAVVVGDPGSGLTTFVGLLYTAQVRLGTETEDRFRFSADRETIRQLESIYGELGSGRFPVRDVSWEEHPLTFLLAFRRGSLVGLGGHRGSDGDFDVVRMRVGGISPHEAAEIRSHEAVWDAPLRRLLRSQVPLLLLDASRWPAEAERPVPGLLETYDRNLARTLELLGRSLAAERGRRVRRMHPVFVVTKLDRCPPETRAFLAMPFGPSATWSDGDRNALGNRVLARYFPETARFLSGDPPIPSLTIEAPRWFFSSLAVDQNGNGGARIRRRERTPLGGWEPEYSFEEYRALLEHVAGLARRLPSPPEP